ncbi:CocE/NonD family hydrolase [Nocardioides sp. NPDC127503]|uniref:CocE/NonD family hydrolase n=1 Tax=Nocardioides sp. NPDC127503 TaxID=3154516 RepID=UPI00331F1327
MTHVYESDVVIPMRDGVKLTAMVFRPADGQAPTLLVRSPYGIKEPEMGTAGNGNTFPSLLAFLDAGYAVVWVECRGAFASEGTFMPKVNEPRDGYDTVEWIVSQPWSDGAVGTYGASYLGMTQWATATQAHPSLRAMVPLVSAMDWYTGIWYHPGGAMSLSVALFWHLVMDINDRLRDLKAGNGDPEAIQALGAGLTSGPALYDHTPVAKHPLLPPGGELPEIIAHPEYDDFWKAQDFTKDISQMSAPVLSIAGWYDVFIVQTLRDFERYRHHAATPEARDGSRLIVGPWEHDQVFTAKTPDRDFGPTAPGNTCNLTGEHLQHFDRWMRPEAPRSEAPARVRLFVMGIDQWRDEQDWPLPDTRYQSYYLAGTAGQAATDFDGLLSEQPPTTASSISYTYDPADPVPTTGGSHMPVGFGFSGPVDQRTVEQRPDVLSFTTPPLEHDIEATGYITATLYVTSNALDTDFTAKLIDVFPDGKAINLCDGILRMRYRNGLESPELMTPGEVYEVEVDMAVTSNVFLAGHRIRVDVSSSNFPRFDRNTNTGGRINYEGLDEAVTATNAILTGPDHPSRVNLPLIAR